MKVVGIICEYNPLHNGHVYHFEKIKEESGADLVILSLSSSFCQRGDISILDKFQKTEAALMMGVDLVSECPVLYTMQEASIFAYHHVLNLNMLHVEEIWIGSESCDIENIKATYEMMKKPVFDEIQKKFLEKGYSLKTSLSKTFEYLKLKPLKSNDILALFYYSAINKINKNIKLKTIKRVGNDYNDTNAAIGNIQSATFIRQNLKIIKPYVPKYTYELLSQRYFDENKLFDFIKYRILNESLTNLKKINEVTEGLENKLKDVYKYDNLSDFIDFLHSKRYSHSKIKRMLINVLLSIKKQDLKGHTSKHNYVRILGYNQDGKNYLSKIKKDILIYTNIKEGLNKALDIELNTTKILDTIYKTSNLIFEQRGPIQK